VVVSVGVFVAVSDAVAVGVNVSVEVAEGVADGEVVAIVEGVTLGVMVGVAEGVDVVVAGPRTRILTQKDWSPPGPMPKYEPWALRNLQNP
jgi:hypothetical protein